jgi:hypothetical protein
LKTWEECLPHAEFAYNRAKHSTTLRSPFMVVYGFEPSKALDILPLPLHERTNMDFDKRANNMKKLHEYTREFKKMSFAKLHDSTQRRKREYSKKMTSFG